MKKITYLCSNHIAIALFYDYLVRNNSVCCSVMHIET